MTEIMINTAMDILIYSLSNLLRIYLLRKYIQIFVGDEEYSGYPLPGRGREALAYGLFFVVNTCLSLSLHMIWVNITVNIVGIGLLVLMYTRNLKIVSFAVFAIYLIHMICDTTSYFLLTDYVPRGKMETGIFSGVVTSFLIFICGLLLEKIINHRKNMEAVQNLPLILVPLCSIVMGCAMLYVSGKENIRAMVVIVSIGLLLLNFLVMCLYNLLLKSFSQKYENEMLRQKVRIYANQIDIILQNEDKVRTLKHDMKHHMNELKLLAGQKHVREIQDYIDSMEEFIENPGEIVASGNVEFDSVLNYMLQKARSCLRTVNARVVIPRGIDHSFDINVILGNLLENAIRAAGESEEKLLNVRVRMRRGVLLVEVENSFRQDGLVRKSGIRAKEVYATTKKDKENHGIGLYSVRKMVEKYNGIMEVHPKGNLFCVKLMLYMA